MTAEAEPTGTQVPEATDTSDPNACPRCGSPIAGQPFYGPCGECRDALRAQLGGSARDVAAETYEPKMNVTPNAVALKDD